MDGVVRYWPMEWPESAGDRWLNRMIEDAAEKAGTVDESNLMPFMQRNIEEIDRLIAKGLSPYPVQAHGSQA